MIVLGADMHKRSHSVAAVGASTGEVVGDKTIRVGDCEFAAAIEWAIGLGDDRVWALEDCRHVSGAFERFVLVRGERVVRVATRLMAGERRAGRDRASPTASMRSPSLAPRFARASSGCRSPSWRALSSTSDC
jgi:transposase